MTELRQREEHQHAAQPAAGGDADDAGRGERVAHDSLQDCAGDGETAAHQRSEQNPRQADVPEYLEFHPFAFREERVENLRRVEPERTEPQPRQQCRRKQQCENRQYGQPVSGGAAQNLIFHRVNSLSG